MECLSGCGHDGKGRCTRDPGCARVSAMAAYILENYPTELAGVVEAGGMSLKQWPPFKSSVEDKLRADIYYENYCLPGSTARKQHLTTSRRRD